MGRPWLAALVLVVAACGPPGDFTGADIDGVAASQVGGVWVFHHDPAGGMDALHRGELRVVDGCLLLGDVLVVWERSVEVSERDGRLTVDLGARRQAEGGEVRIGGGFGWEVGDPGSAPSPMSEHCPGRSVFYMSP